MTAKSSTTIRIEPEIKSALLGLADRQRRSLSGLIGYICGEYLERCKQTLETEKIKEPTHAHTYGPQ